ncbi:hypothetical protein EST38_g9696 [Candolleomyces aberdarensis]|uniref:Uncharacterized protein n=1 Tax=Candolleomyces aberdarensis TaxID=2316362 RepID=A0A4Q2D9A3_9AGAR|nr:hypothetical protein EST38_g9696 [Candolleomyces aberdarensis]
MTQEVAQDRITKETRDVMQDSRQGEDNIATSVDHSKATVDSGRLGWEQDFDRLRANMSTQMKAWEDSQRSSITKQLESFKAQQELQILRSIRSEALDAQTRLDNQAAELRNTLDICRKEWEEMSTECQTLRAREFQLTADLSEARLALTRQTLDHQADKVKLLEELNMAKSALQLHQIKLSEEMNAAKSAQVELLEEPSTASTGLAALTAGVNVAKLKKSENDEVDGSEITFDEEAHTEETGSQEELRVQELGRIGPIGEGPPDVIVPQCPQAGANDPLQERRRRWQTLTWRNQETYNIEGPCSAYQLAEGMFIKTSKEGNMLILQLPTSGAPVYRAITHCNLNTKIFGFASDASQDLLVFFGCDSEFVWIVLHSPTGSKPAPHPEATRQILQVQKGRYTYVQSNGCGCTTHGASDDPKDYTLKIAGDFVGMLIYSRRKLLSRLLVWNWKTGMLIGDTLGTKGHSFGTAYEFSFVSPTLFHVTTLANGVGSIDLYSISPSRFTHLASLLLPPVKQGVNIVPARRTAESLQPNGFPNHFGTSQLSVLHIEYATQFGFFDSEQFHLVVPTSVFTDYWNDSQSKTLKLPITAQWNDWGPSKTRWIPQPPIPSSLLDSRPEKLWTRHLHGQRVLALPTESPGIEVLDFEFDPDSPPVNQDPSLQQDICIGPTVIPAGNVFRDDLVSTLPYIKTTRRGVLDEDFAGFAIDEERIIAISSSITKHLESYRAQQELQILKSIQSEASNTQTRPDAQAAELRKALDICHRERDELFRECQTLRSRERQLSDDLNETRLAFTRQTLDLQADKVKLLEELNEARSISHSEKVKLLEELHAAKSAHQVDHVKLLDDLNAAKSAQIKLLEELSTARTALAGMTAGANVVKMKKLNDDSNGSETTSEGEASAQETASPEELRVQESRRIGLIDEGPPAVVVPQCPQAGADEPLQERRRRWQTLTWRNRKTYNIEGSCSAYQLAGGMFIKTSKEGNMLVLQLPTSNAPVYQAITYGNLNTKSLGFASDASQDLLVFFGCDSQSVWIAMYSPTGSKPAPHPEATKQILQVSNHYDPEQAKWGRRQLYGASDHPNDYTLKIAGDFVGMLIFIPSLRKSRLLVWNWKIGTLIGDTLEPQDYWFDATAYEFSFVSPTLLHVTTPTNGNGAGSINLYSINPSSSPSARFTHLASLLLPPAKKDVEIVPVRCTTESLQANGLLNQFGTSQLSVLQIKYATHFGFFDSEQFQLVVPTSVFIDYCNKLQSKTLKLPITAQWDDWGPSKTRWISRPHIPSSLFDSRPENLWTRCQYLRGQRVLALPTEGPGVEVLDFDFDPDSPPVNPDPSLQQDICTGPTVIPAGNVFRDDVVSTLPYMKTTRRGVLDEDFAGFAIDEERIIAISVEGTGSNQRISKLTTMTF